MDILMMFGSGYFLSSLKLCLLQQHNPINWKSRFQDPECTRTVLVVFSPPNTTNNTSASQQSTQFYTHYALKSRIARIGRSKEDGALVSRIVFYIVLSG